MIKPTETAKQQQEQTAVIKPTETAKQQQEQIAPLTHTDQGLRQILGGSTDYWKLDGDYAIRVNAHAKHSSLHTTAAAQYHKKNYMIGD